MRKTLLARLNILAVSALCLVSFTACDDASTPYGVAAMADEAIRSGDLTLLRTLLTSPALETYGTQEGLKDLQLARVGLELYPLEASLVSQSGGQQIFSLAIESSPSGTIKHPRTTFLKLRIACAEKLCRIQDVEVPPSASRRSLAREIDPTKKNLALLISFDNRIGNQYAYDHDFLSDLTEHVFRDAFEDEGYNLIVKHNADLRDLFDVMQSDAVSGVFWSSHGAHEDATPIGHSPGAIIDYRGFDLSPAFARLASSRQFFASLSCESDLVMAALPFPRPAPSFFAHGYAIPNMVLHKAISAFREHAEKASLAHNTSLAGEKTVQLTIRRTASANLRGKLIPAVQIRHQGRVIGAMTGLTPGKSDTIRVSVPAGLFTGKADISNALIIDAGRNFMRGLEDVELGNFEIVSENGTRWDLERDDEGRALGVSTHIYTPASQKR